MKRTKKTRRALITSLVSLVLCCALLLGTTFAWFTDSVTNTGNKIVAGNLEVSLLQAVDTLSEAQKTELNPAAGDAYVDISDSAEEVFDYDLWEPGYSNGATLKVKNTGNLALKYDLTVSNVTEKTGAENGGDATATGKLSEVLDIYLLDSYRAPTASDTPVCSVAELIASGGKVISSGILAAGTESADLHLVVMMRTSAGNAYQKASASFDIQLRAMQAPLEEDGFGSAAYDANATGDPDNAGWGTITTGRVTVPVVGNGAPTILKDSYGVTTFSVPDAAIAEDATDLTLDITEEDTVYPDVKPAPGQTAKTYDITIEGLKENNDEPVTVSFYIGKGLTGVQVYHYGTLISDAEYDPNTGIVTFTSTTFSPYTVLFDTVPTVTVSTAADFLAAIREDGKKVLLDADITITSYAEVPEGVTTSIDLGGHTVSGYGIRNFGTITSLTNGTIHASSGYGIDNRGTIGTLNCKVVSEKSDAISNGTGTRVGEEYVSTAAVIEEISGGEYLGHPTTYGSSTVGSCGLYNGSLAVVKLISGGYFQGSSVAFRSYNAKGIESVTGGFFDCPYMDANGRTFCDNTTIGNVFYNSAPLSVTGGTWYNVGTKINSKLPEGYTLTQGAVCEMTSGKTYVRYDAVTQAPAHWVADENGATYYYYTVVAE